MKIKSFKKVTDNKSRKVPEACGSGPDNGLEKPPC